MTEEDAFIAGIREHPLDDLRRLVYADWLEERGRAEEADYLRLVAALAAPGTAVDVKHPHSIRLFELADRLDHIWREAVGSRFDLWLTARSPLHGAAFHSSVLRVSGWTEARSEELRRSLPTVLSGRIPVEEAMTLEEQFIDTYTTSAIVPSTSMLLRGPLRRSVALMWQEPFGFGPSLLVTEADMSNVLHHLRRVLTADSETASGATALPFEDGGYGFTLAADLLWSEARRQVSRWSERLTHGAELEGEAADPPFPGTIHVCLR